MSSICYVDLRFDVAPNWSLEGGREIVSISEEDFIAATRPDGQLATLRSEQSSSTKIEAHLEMKLANGHRLFMSARGPGIPEQVRARTLLRALDTPCIWSHLSDTGFRLVNTAMIRYVTSYPGPPEVPGSAIHARRLD